MRNLNAQLFLTRSLYLKQTWVAELHYSLRFQVDEMVVLAEFVGALILRTVVPKLVLDDQAAVEQHMLTVLKTNKELIWKSLMMREKYLLFIRRNL